MERQYIGARYVPIFVGEWNESTSYEPLSIVTYMNGSYTSRKAVPAGIVPTNNTYWAMTGNYNAQVEEYRQSVVALQSDVDTVSDNYEKITDTIAYWGGGNVWLAGDSNMARMFNQANFKLDKYLPNCTINSVAVGGSTWLDIYGQLQQISNVPNIIIILSGGNDMRSAVNYASGSSGSVGDYLGNPDVTKHTYSLSTQTQTFEGMRTALAYIRTTYPECEIICLSRSDYPASVSVALASYYKYFEFQIMQEWGVPVIDLQCVLNATDFIAAQTDWVIYDNHYSAKAYERIQRKLGAILNSGNPCNTGFDPPTTFYSPTFSVQETTSISFGAIRCNWAMNHCYPRTAGNYGFALEGTVVTKSSWTRFSGHKGSSNFNNDILMFFSDSMQFASGAVNDDEDIAFNVRVADNSIRVITGTDVAVNSIATSNGAGVYTFNAANVTGLPSAISSSTSCTLIVTPRSGTNLSPSSYFMFLIPGNNMSTIYVSQSGSNNWYVFTGESAPTE